MINVEIVNTEIPSRIDKYIKSILPLITNGVLNKYIRSGAIKLNNKKINTLATKVINQDLIQISEYIYSSYSSSDNDKNFSANVIKLADKILSSYLLYQDINLIAINKPYGLAVQGGSKVGVSVNDAINYINHQFNWSLKIVHRLDKETSGILLIAKNRDTAIRLSVAFKEKSIQKVYLAILKGKVPEGGTIKSVLLSKKEKDQLCITHYKLLKYYKGYSLVEFAPVTGRNHQIRKHATYELNAPIVGDIKYNGENYTRLLLHASKITIPKHIIQNTTNTIESLTPQIINNFFAKLA